MIWIWDVEVVFNPQFQLWPIWPSLRKNAPNRAAHLTCAQLCLHFLSRLHHVGGLRSRWPEAIWKPLATHWKHQRSCDNKPLRRNHPPPFLEVAKTIPTWLAYLFIYIYMYMYVYIYYCFNHIIYMMISWDIQPIISPALQSNRNVPGFCYSPLHPWCTSLLLRTSQFPCLPSRSFLQMFHWFDSGN